MLTIGDRLPTFELQAVVSREPGLEFSTITEHSFPGKWLVLFFWPMDFTFVCPTEIAEFGRKNEAFAAHDAQVLGASIDSQYVHLAWRDQNPMLGDLPYPMLSDVKRELGAALGVLHEDGVALRATFIVDPGGVIRWATANDLSVGRNVDEVLRTLVALQTEQLTPCNWHEGEPTLRPARSATARGGARRPIRRERTPKRPPRPERRRGPSRREDSR
jgi:alkyl hydroperoxide reductase subunit AhpC